MYIAERRELKKAILPQSGDRRGGNVEREKEAKVKCVAPPKN